MSFISLIYVKDENNSFRDNLNQHQTHKNAFNGIYKTTTTFKG